LATHKSAHPLSNYTIEVSIAGWILFIATIWELIFNRLFTSIGLYNHIGTTGPLGQLANSGYFSLNIVGILSLILTGLMLRRLASDSKLAPIAPRILLIFASPFCLPGVCIAIFRLVPTWIIFVAYIVAVFSIVLLTIIVAISKVNGSYKRIIIALCLVQFLSAIELLFPHPFLNKVYVFSEMLFIATPLFSFFVFCPGPVLNFIKRPHLIGLVFAMFLTTIATVFAKFALSISLLTLTRVAHRTFGITLAIPLSDSLIYLPYVISFFFGTLTIGSLIFPSKKWPPNQDSRRIGFGLTLIWAFGVQANQPYQFIAIIMGFFYLTYGMLLKNK